jgi:hypothetical protein
LCAYKDRFRNPDLVNLSSLAANKFLSKRNPAPVPRESARNLEARRGYSFALAGRARIRWKRIHVKYKQLMVLLGIILGSHAPAVAQAPLPPIVAAQERIAPSMTVARAAAVPLLSASSVANLEAGKSPARFSLLFAGGYEGDHSLESFPQLEQTKTLLFTQTSVPLIQLWGGRLQLDAFQSTFHIQNMQPGAVGVVRSPGQSYPGGPRSSQLSGVSLSFEFGRGARGERPSQLWRHLTRIAGNVLN